MESMRSVKRISRVSMKPPKYPETAPTEDAGQGAQQGGRKTHEEGDPSSLQQPRQDVAAQFVGPQPVGRRGRLKMLLQVDPAVAVRREPGSHERAESNDPQEAQGDHGQAMPAEPLPGGVSRSGS